MRKKNTFFDYTNYFILIILGLVMVYPVLYVFSVSVSDSASVATGSVSFYPRGINLSAYKKVMLQEQFWVGYKNTIYYTFLSTVFGLATTIMMAYPISKKNLPGRKFFSCLIAVSMFLPVGLIPSFLLIKSLGWINTTWSIVIPGALQAYYIIIARSFFEGIPDSLDDAASIDGLNDIEILMKIYLPLSKPILATIGLYYAVGAWNSWFQAMIYLSEQSKMPVMIFLRNIVNGAEMAANNPEMVDTTENIISPVVRSATIICVILPIICVYPFIQKYFVKGVMIGSVKG